MTGTKRARKKPASKRRRNGVLEMNALAATPIGNGPTPTREQLEESLWSLTVAAMIDDIGELQTTLAPHNKVKEQFDRLDKLRSELRKLLEVRPPQEIHTYRGAAFKAIVGAKAPRREIKNLQAVHAKLGDARFYLLVKPMSLETLERELGPLTPLYTTLQLTGPRPLEVVKR